MNFTQYRKNLHEHFADKEFGEVFGQYKQYLKKTLEVVRGKTVQFWFGCINMPYLYHKFIRRIH